MKLSTLVLAAFLLPLGLLGQIPNSNFEVWYDIFGRYVPEGWDVSSFGTKQSPEGHDGEHALQVHNWYSYALGYAFLGSSSIAVWSNFDQGGIPIDFRPDRLIGWYQYDEGQNGFDGMKSDSAAVYIMLKRYNAELDRTDTVGFTIALLGRTTGWTRFEIPIPQLRTDIEPDSIAIGFFSSNPENVARCGPDSSNCSYFTIDALSLGSASGVEYTIDVLREEARVMPNPVGTDAVIEFDGDPDGAYRLRIVDAVGRHVRTIGFSGCRYAVRTDDLTAGAYRFTIEEKSGRVARSGSFIVR